MSRGCSVQPCQRHSVRLGWAGPTAGEQLCGDGECRQLLRGLQKSGGSGRGDVSIGRSGGAEGPQGRLHLPLITRPPSNSFEFAYRQRSIATATNYCNNDDSFRLLTTVSRVSAASTSSIPSRRCEVAVSSSAAQLFLYAE